MANYINRNQKQAIYTLYGVKDFAEGLLASPLLPEQNKIKRSIQAIVNHSSKVIDFVMSQIDKDAAHGLYRFSRSIELVCMSRADPRGLGEYTLVKTEEILRVLESNHECLFCEKRGKEAQKCDLRKIAFNWQLTPLGTGDCPFRREY